MKIAVIGVGAMGSIYAALLAAAGHEVWAVDTWADHLEAIRTKGLRVEGASGDRTVKSIKTTTNMADLAGAGLFILATKASGVGPAAKAIAPYCGVETPVLTIQNGLGAGERIAEFLPAGHVLIGVADGFGASMKGPGHAHHNNMKLIRIGEMKGGLTPRVERIAQVWRDAGFNVQAYSDVIQLVWEKFIVNVTFSAPCTAFGCTIEELMADPERWRIAKAAMREAYELGLRRGVKFSIGDPDDYVTRFGQAMPKARPSMLLDHLARKRSEIDAINGMVSVVGREVGLPTPCNDVLAAVVRAREATFAAGAA